MKYAVIGLDGKQFMVEEGMTLDTNRLEDPSPKVLLYKENGKTMVGTPEVPGVKVKLSKKNDYIEKTTIGRFKSKSRYRRKKGHKQPMSTFLVEKITYSKKKDQKEEK